MPVGQAKQLGAVPLNPASQRHAKSTSYVGSTLTISMVVLCFWPPCDA